MPHLSYKLACLCDLRDDRGRVLLLRRSRPPNKGLYSPIGGKLDMSTGESPLQCAMREIHEEAGIDIPPNRLHLLGIITECAYEGNGHWLMFYYRVIGPVSVELCEIPEGTLDWHDPSDISDLALPETDRCVIWPLVDKHASEGSWGFFAAHIACSDGSITWTLDQSIGSDAATTGSARG